MSGVTVMESNRITITTLWINRCYFDTLWFGQKYTRRSCFVWSLGTYLCKNVNFYLLLWETEQFESLIFDTIALKLHI